MVRRRLAIQPTSRLAIWARRCAFFALIATVLSIVIVRAGLLEIVPSLATFAAAQALAAFAIILAFAAFVVIWKDGIDGGGAAFVAFAIGAALVAYPAYLGVKAYRLPMINDITTDPIDPPKFEVVARLRPRGTIDYPGLYAAEQQRAAYPDVEPLDLAAPPQTAYEAALAVIAKRKWRVVAERPPQIGRRDGQIEAVARTAIMGFRDDVAVRIRATRDGSRIDVRSASRFGRTDFGGNASRIRALLDEVDDRVSAQSEEKALRPPAKKAPAKTPPAKKDQPAKR